MMGALITSDISVNFYETTHGNLKCFVLTSDEEFAEQSVIRLEIFVMKYIHCDGSLISTLAY